MGSKLKFQLGKMFQTQGVRREFSLADIITCLALHASGDWGDMEEEDKALNDEALANNDGRLFSAYNIGEKRVWIITESDRSSTTVLLPDEY